MKAQDYLEYEKAARRYFSYLVTIAELPYRALSDDHDERKADKRALPPHIQKAVETVIGRLGQSLTAEQREALWKHEERMEANQVSDLEWPRMIHQQFMAKISDEGQKILSGKDIAVGLLRDASFRGSVVEVPESENGWVITLYEGFSAIIYSFARTLASTFTMTPSNGGGGARPTITPEDAALSLFDMLRHEVFVGVPIQKREDAADLHLHLAFRLTDMAEKFTYAHEISHILLGHDMKSARHILSIAGEESSEIDPSIEEEIEADLFAWNILCRVLLPENGGIKPSDLQMAYAGTRLFLRVAQLLERAENVSMTGTHPPTADRLDYIRTAALDVAKKFNVSFEQLKAVDDGMQAAMTELEKALPPFPCWQSPVAEIIEKAVTVTSKHGFFLAAGTDARLIAVHEILRLLSFGRPHKLCRELGRTMGKAMLELKASGIDVTAEESSDAPPYGPEVIKASLPAFTAFWIIAALESAYLPREIFRHIERERDHYIKEQKHAA